MINLIAFIFTIGCKSNSKTTEETQNVDNKEIIVKAKIKKKAY